MNQYLLCQAGRNAVLMEQRRLVDARAELRYLVSGELRRAKSRYPGATLHKHSPDSYSITIGKDKRSSLYTSLSITPAL